MVKQDALAAAFNEAYASLNAAQKEAVDTIEGPVMVIAGPGTGKTQILTLRIANILLKTDTAPESILALTFTESGAKAMRERLRRYIGTRAYRVSIYTFHGFCGGLIRDYPDAYGDIIGGRVATEMDKINLLETILDSGALKLLRPMGNPIYYIAPLKNIISTLKQEYITPDRLADIIARQETELAGIEKIHEKGAHKGKVRGEYTKKEKAIAKNRELLVVYRQYEALLREQKLYDYDDMIGKTIEALAENEDMLRDLQEQYQYVLADEHQDVNGSQNRILELLTSYHDSPNIFVVGDEKQAIYRFQGASLENFLYFDEVYRGTKTISLTENYRSGQTILDTAHSLVGVDDGPLKDLRIPLSAAAVAQSSVETRNYSHAAVEHDDLVSLVKASLASGIPASEVAVIVRTNKEVEMLAELLRNAGLSVTASADGDILSHPITQQVSNLIDAVIKPEDESALFTILHGAYWGIDTNDLVTVCSAQSYDQPLTALLSHPDKLQALKLNNPEALFKVHEVLTEARVRASTDSPQRVLAYVLEESGFIQAATTGDGLESGRVIRRLYDEIEALVTQNETLTLKGVSQALATYREHGLGLNAPYIASSTEAVAIMTAHKSKGLEFTEVFIPHFTDNVWGGKRRRLNFDIPLTRHQHDEFDDIDDERRLLYVALTRAKHKVYLSQSDTDTSGKELVASRLQSELDESLLAGQDVSASEAKFVPTDKLKQAKHHARIDTGLLIKTLSDRGFSATSLNNYLRSPWDYLYRNVLRIPEVQPPHMQFGTAIHGVMESVTRAHTKNGVVPNDSELKTLLEVELGKLPLSKEEFVRLHEKGLEALFTYVPHVAKSLPKQTEEEKKIRVTLETGLPEIPELTLTGMLDRLDFSDDGQVRRVVDYKTGKPKTRNAIEGKTASDDGGYKRQLVFYALLLSLYEDDRYQTREGVLSFVQPDQKGVIHEEAFVITDEEIASLQTEIINATKEIIAGDWLTAPIEAGSTEYEQLAKLLVGE